VEEWSELAHFGPADGLESSFRPGTVLELAWDWEAEFARRLTDAQRQQQQQQQRAANARNWMGFWQQSPLGMRTGILLRANRWGERHWANVRTGACPSQGNRRGSGAGRRTVRAVARERGQQSPNSTRPLANRGGAPPATARRRPRERGRT